jgi:hypothetical protein
MNKQLEFPNGIRAFQPTKNAPEWVRGSLVLNKTELMDWLRSQGNEIRLDIKQSKKGSWYLSVSDFTPQEKGFYKKSDFNQMPPSDVAMGTDYIDDLPF